MAAASRSTIPLAVALAIAFAFQLPWSAAADAPGPIDRSALTRAANPPLGLPPVPIPVENPMTPEKIALGRKLFFDRRLSHNDTISCAMCHVPEQGFTVNELATAVGIEGRTVRRNAPTVVNTAYLETIFHDGRETSLETQVLAPLVDKNEMGNPSLGYVVAKIERLADYDGLFEKAFGRGPSVETLGQAVAAWERTLISGNSPFDRWYYGGEEDALTGAAKRGFALFKGVAGCSRCHQVDVGHALFTDHLFHNTGIGYRNTHLRSGDDEVLIELAPGVNTIVKSSALDSITEGPPQDLGRYEVTLNPEDHWHIKTPSLRNVALTAPYMHDGSLLTLHEVVYFYVRGGVEHAGLDHLIEPLDLEDGDVDDIVAFLESLTGDNVAALVADARSVPVGNLTLDDAASMDGVRER